MGRLSVLAGVLTALALAASPATATTNCIFTTGPVGPGGPTMKLKADCTTDETIFVPDGFTLDGGNHTITAVDPPGGHFRGAIVQNAVGATTMNVQRLKLKASNLADPSVCDSGNDRLRGIAMLGVGGTVRDVRIDGLKQGTGNCPEGSGIVANNLPVTPGTPPPTRSLLIENVKVHDFQFVGIQVQGQIVAQVRRNQVVGTPEPGIPPNGQIGFFIANGATVELRDNTILQDDTSTNINVIAVFVEDSSKNVIEHNTINGSAEGIFIESFCSLLGQGANKNRVAKNSVQVTREGIVLIARSFPGTTVCDPHVDDNNVDDNDIVALDGGADLTGVFVGTDTQDAAYTPVANKNTIKNNTIDGFQNPIFQSGDTNTVIKNNTIIP